VARGRASRHAVSSAWPSRSRPFETRDGTKRLKSRHSFRLRSTPPSTLKARADDLPAAANHASWSDPPRGMHRDRAPSPREARTSQAADVREPGTKTIHCREMVAEFRPSDRPAPAAEFISGSVAPQAAARVLRHGQYANCFEGVALLLLHHPRPRDPARGDRVLGPRPLRPVRNP